MDSTQSHTGSMWTIRETFVPDRRPPASITFQRPCWLRVLLSRTFENLHAKRNCESEMSPLQRAFLRESNMEGQLHVRLSAQSIAARLRSGTLVFGNSASVTLAQLSALRLPRPNGLAPSVLRWQQN